MKECVSGIVPTASDTATYQTDPQVGIRAASSAFIESCLLASDRVPPAKAILSISTDGAAASSPLLQAGAVENMLT